MDKAEQARCAIILPIDGVVAWHFEANTPSRTYGLDAIDKDGMVLDAGPQSIEKIKTAINEAKTIVWNGPLGAFEIAPFYVLIIILMIKPYGLFGTKDIERI